MTRFTVLIPLRNEAKVLVRNIRLLLSFLSGFSENCDILLVENGSKDETPELLKRIVRDEKNVNYISLPRPSLGVALFKGILLSKNECVVYLPMDLSVNLSFVPISVRLLGYCDIVLGSKRLRTASDRRTLVRKLLSILYSRLIRLLFGLSLSDTTCVKAFRKSKIIPIMRTVRFMHIFDTELMIRARRLGCKIVEIPVHVHDTRLPRESLLMKIVRKIGQVVTLRITLWFEET